MTSLAVRGISLYVQIMGRGYPLLIMHGGPGADYTTMLSLLPCAVQFTLVFYDHRCHSRSEGAPVSSMNWHNLTAGAEALRNRLGFEKWAVLGHSFGGMVAMEYALRYPDSNPSRLAYKLLAGPVPALRSEVLIYGSGQLLRDWTTMDRLGAIAVPTLVIAGRDDFLYPPEHQVTLANAIADARLEIVERAGHYAHQEQTGEVIRIIKQFLATAEAGPVTDRQSIGDAVRLTE